MKCIQLLLYFHKDKRIQNKTRYTFKFRINSQIKIYLNTFWNFNIYVIYIETDDAM